MPSLRTFSVEQQPLFLQHNTRWSDELWRHKSVHPTPPSKPLPTHPLPSQTFSPPAPRFPPPHFPLAQYRSVTCRRHAARRDCSRHRGSRDDEARRRHSRSRVCADEDAISRGGGGDQALGVSCQPACPGRAGRASPFCGTVHGREGSGQQRVPQSALQEDFAHVRAALEEAV